MKTTQKQLEDMILAIGGEEALPVYKALHGKENVNEFLLAAKLKMTINQLRNTLYKFDAYNLVSSTRKKDRKKGWYIYFWTFNEGRADEVVLRLKREKLELLRKQLEREESHQFYLCPSKDIRTTLENAMEMEFICPECGQLLALEDNGRNLNRIKKDIWTLEKEIGDTSAEAEEVAA
ncbi:hypothetical protein HZB00_01410 [Candidatus Woesearchaeota archaeon]|nr:hypothetical protein [Candidatus Woesearchaeota archaeon]